MYHLAELGCTFDVVHQFLLLPVRMRAHAERKRGRQQLDDSRPLYASKTMTVDPRRREKGVDVDVLLELHPLPIELPLSLLESALMIAQAFGGGERPAEEGFLSKPVVPIELSLSVDTSLTKGEGGAYEDVHAVVSVREQGSSLGVTFPLRPLSSLLPLTTTLSPILRPPCLVSSSLSVQTPGSPPHLSLSVAPSPSLLHRKSLARTRRTRSLTGVLNECSAIGRPLVRMEKGAEWWIISGGKSPIGCWRGSRYVARLD
jgi:hypothetical protein